jgi:hypothetical protein
MRLSCSFPKQATPKILSSSPGFALLFFTFLATLTLVVHLTCSLAYPAQVTLAWDAAADPGVTGYKLHIGPASGNYTQSIDVGNVTTYIVSDLSGGSTYYFATTSLDATGNESGYSNEISTTLPVLYSITATSDSNGTITPLGNPPVSQASSGSTIILSVTVNRGTSQSFTITPNAGYRVAEVKVDGVSVGSTGSFSFNNVTGNHVLSATFAVNAYSIPATTGKNRKKSIFTNTATYSNLLPK